MTSKTIISRIAFFLLLLNVSVIACAQVKGLSEEASKALINSNRAVGEAAKGIVPIPGAGVAAHPPIGNNLAGTEIIKEIEKHSQSFREALKEIPPIPEDSLRKWAKKREDEIMEEHPELLRDSVRARLHEQFRITDDMKFYDVFLDCCAIENNSLWKEKAAILCQRLSKLEKKKTEEQWLSYVESGRSRGVRFLLLFRRLDQRCLDYLAGPEKKHIGKAEGLLCLALDE